MPKAAKAYKDLAFLNSASARVLRILAEYLEPKSRFQKKNVRDTIVFFGSARILDAATAQERLDEAQKINQRNPSPDNERKLKEARVAFRMSRYYEEARELSRKLTEWSIGLNHKHRRFIIVSGGGPGIMESANRGACEVDGGRSIGLNISLPFEQESNPYICSDLNLEFHYFFMRKFWFIYLAKALVVFPGGFGTMDEMWEVLTLIQTGKVHKALPVVIYGEEYWRKVINFDEMVEHGTISREDLELFKFCNSVDEAFEYLKNRLTKYYL